MRKQRQRESVAQGILNQLYDTLKANEREWYTRQVPVRPTIAVSRDSSLNAYALVARNNIVISLGTFEAAESLGTKTDVTNAKALLAGVIGHELAHIFYRHPGDRSSGLWGELTGALAVDRRQEQQADVLGAFLACQAGYSSDGLAKFMKLLISAYGNQGDFGRTHPNSQSRVAMIERVAARCPANGR